MICLDVDKTVADDVRQDLATHGVTKDALGLASDDWARQHYESFLKTLGT